MVAACSSVGRLLVDCPSDGRAACSAAVRVFAVLWPLARPLCICLPLGGRLLVRWPCAARLVSAAPRMVVCWPLGGRLLVRRSLASRMCGTGRPKNAQRTSKRSPNGKNMEAGGRNKCPTDEETTNKLSTDCKQTATKRPNNDVYSKLKVLIALAPFRRARYIHSCTRGGLFIVL